MSQLLLHPQTEKRVADFLSNPSHAITIIAPTGSGKHSLAWLLASQLLSVESANIISHPYVKVISPVEGKAIGIESIRELEHFLSLKVPSHNSIHRVIIIEDADLLTIEAQNSFLKTLEEPPAGSVFILTASHDQALLPTIRSRSPRLLITRPDYESLRQYFDKLYDGKDVKQALLVSGGLPGLASALLSEATEHPLLPATDMARKLLGSTKYERLLYVDELSKDKGLSLNTLFIIQQMAHLSLLTSENSATKRWLDILKYSYEAQVSIMANNQSKLVLTNLILHL